MSKSLLSLLALCALAATSPARAQAAPAPAPAPAPAKAKAKAPAAQPADAAAADLEELPAKSKKAESLRAAKKPAMDATDAEITGDTTVPTAPAKLKRTKPAAASEGASGTSAAAGDTEDPPQKKARPRPAGGAQKIPASANQAEGARAVKKLTPTQSTKLLALLNEGGEEALQTIPGVGMARARAITKARPFTAVADLGKVDGIGEDSLEDVLAWVEDGMKSEESATPPSGPTARARKAATRAKP